MKLRRLLFLAITLAAVIVTIVCIRANVLPRGIPGEWEWAKQTMPASAFYLAIAGFGVVVFAAFAAFGSLSLRDRPSRRREAVWVTALLLASVSVQITTMAGGAAAQGLTKWVTLGMKGSSGYFDVAREQMADPWKFWKDYPSWIRKQDALHIGTHPPGLFVLSKYILGLTERSPKLTSFVLGMLPPEAAVGFRTILSDRTRAERAAFALMGFLTLVACAGTVVPLYLLARSSLPANSAWATAVLWPIAPAVVLFQPTADTAFPLLATTSLALAAGGGLTRSALSGIVLAVGMQFSLVFLPVGLMVAILLLIRTERTPKQRRNLVLATGAGFSILTGVIWCISRANPFAIWWVNQLNHARFYKEYPRTYWAWLIANPIELAIAIGIPTSLLAGVAMVRRRAPKPACIAAGVLLLLNLSGKNLGEVARLWLPFMPPLLLAAGAEVSKESDDSWSLAAILIFVGIQTAAFQIALEVVYPFG